MASSRVEVDGWMTEKVSVSARKRVKEITTEVSIN